MSPIRAVPVPRNAWFCERAGHGDFGERGGTRTHDPMIKSHVLYRLSYALTLS